MRCLHLIRKQQPEFHLRFGPGRMAVSSVSRGGGGKVSQSSRNWLRRQEKDVYVKRARAEGSPSRSIFKLEQIVQRAQKKNKYFLRKDDAVIDLGVSYELLYAVCCMLYAISDVRDKCKCRRCMFQHMIHDS